VAEQPVALDLRADFWSNARLSVLATLVLAVLAQAENVFNYISEYVRALGLLLPSAI
jgi:hypothetical protein